MVLVDWLIYNLNSVDWLLWRTVCPSNKSLKVLHVKMWCCAEFFINNKETTEVQLL